MALPATDVFLSYKAEDRARLEGLVDALQAEGFSVWWDARIGGGANWQQDIEQHLDGAHCVIVAWSKRSVGEAGDFVRDEARRAQRRGAYLPVCLDGVEPPLGFGEIQALSLKGWRGNRSDRRFQAIAEAVRARVPERRVPRSTDDPRQPGVSRRAVIAGGAGVAAIAAAGGGWFLLRPEAANSKRIAVLPFANLSGADDQAYFAEGIAEELRSALARIGLEVIGRTSSDAVKDMDTKAAAAKLDVANILTGSVRRSPNTIRINAQLVSGSDGVERWGQSYDRAPGDAIKIQADIAENVAQALSITLGKAVSKALTLGGTADPVAQDLVLQSREPRRTGTLEGHVRQTLALAEAAIARDPRYADAYVVKARAHSSLADLAITDPETASQLRQADAAARKAIALAPGWGSAYASLANIQIANLDIAGGLRTAKRALALSPEDPTVVATAAAIVATCENVDAGLRLADRAISLDPLRSASHWNKAFALILAKRYRQSIEVGQKAISLEPESRGPHLPIGDAYLLLGDARRAKAEYEALPHDNPFTLARLSLVAARTGDRAGALRILAQMKRQFGPVNSYQYAQLHAQLADSDMAFDELENAVRRRDGGLPNLKFDPFLEPIRRDPRYAALLKRLNFPA